jgi:hypothetical protein
MTIEELNKLIKEELEAYLGEEEGDDEVKVTTDEPEDKGDEALDTLKQIFNMLKPIVDDEEEAPVDDEDEGEEDAEEEEEEEPIEEVTESDLVGSYNPEAISNTQNALSELTGIPLNIIVLLVVFGIPLALMYGPDAVANIKAAVSKVPGFVRRAAEKALAIVQKSGKSGTEIAQDVKDAEEAAQRAVTAQFSKDNNLDVSEATNAQKVKFIKEYLTSLDENLDHPNYRADYVKDVAHNAEKIKGGLNESVNTVARFKKLANIK